MHTVTKMTLWLYDLLYCPDVLEGPIHSHHICESPCCLFKRAVSLIAFSLPLTTYNYQSPSDLLNKSNKLPQVSCRCLVLIDEVYDYCSFCSDRYHSDQIVGHISHVTAMNPVALSCTIRVFSYVWFGCGTQILHSSDETIDSSWSRVFHVQSARVPPVLVALSAVSFLISLVALVVTILHFFWLLLISCRFEGAFSLAVGSWELWHYN